MKKTVHLINLIKLLKHGLEMDLFGLSSRTYVTGREIYSDFLSQAKEFLNYWQNENGQRH
jgi:hypothetical protein